MKINEFTPLSSLKFRGNNYIILSIEYVSWYDSYLRVEYDTLSENDYGPGIALVDENGKCQQCEGECDFDVVLK